LKQTTLKGLGRQYWGIQPTYEELKLERREGRDVVLQ